MSPSGASGSCSNPAGGEIPRGIEIWCRLLEKRLPTPTYQITNDSGSDMMRLDKLTTKLQEALADAQSEAVGNDNQYIEPVHLLVALLNQDDSSARSLLQRAGVNVGGLTNALKGALARLPKV